MKFQYLDYFYDLCITKNFSKTASNFFVSQPVISNAIKNLELYFDTLLIERKKFNNHFIITEDGYELLEFIKKFQQYKIELAKSIVPKPQNKNFNIGILNLSQNYIFKNFIKNLLNSISYDLNKNFIFEENIYDLHQNLLNNNLDVCLSYYLEKNNKISTIKSYKLDNIFFDIFFSQNYKLYYEKLNLQKLNLQKLNNQVFICFKQNSINHKLLQTIIKQNKLTPKKIIFVDNMQILESMLNDNAGIAILTRGTIFTTPTIKSIELENNYNISVYLEINQNTISTEISNSLIKNLSLILKGD